MLFALKKCAFRSVHFSLALIAPILPYPIPKLISGEGSIGKLPGAIQATGVSNVLLVTDPGIISAGLVDPLETILRDSGIKYTLYSDVQPNPTIPNVENGLKVYLENNCKGVVVIGGGSAMDCAKTIAARAANPKKSIAKMRGYFRIPKAIAPFFAIPTTAGTGSETTIAAVIADPETHEKFAVTSFKLVPDVAVLDPELMKGLPPHITSTTGMDALTHAVEAYLNLTDSPATRKLSETAVRLIFDNLEGAFQDGSDMEKRNNMALASYYAGAAFTRTFVGYAHAFAHNMGGLYNVPHGLANAIILPLVLDFSREAAEKRLARLAVVAGFGEAGESTEALSYRFINKVRGLNAKMGIPTKIKELQEKDFDLIIDRAFAEAHPAILPPRIMIYPVPEIMSRRDAEDLLKALLP